MLKVIHGDLSARNVLVGEGEACKVTNFGMARDVQEDNIYERKTRAYVHNWLFRLFWGIHMFHNYQASSDCHSRWTWPKEIMNNDTKMNFYVKIFLHM